MIRLLYEAFVEVDGFALQKNYENKISEKYQFSVF